MVTSVRTVSHLKTNTHFRILDRYRRLKHFRNLHIISELYRTGERVSAWTLRKWGQGGGPGVANLVRSKISS
jgi:hypothetical protein